MRICHVVPSLAPSHGGPPVVASRLAAAQAALGHDVSILFYDAPAEHAEIDEAMRAIPGADRLRLIPLPAPRGRLAGLLSSSSAAIADAIRPSEIVHLHGVWERLIRETARAAGRLGKPYVVAPHGMLDPWSLQQKALKKKVALVLGYRAMLDRAAFLHVLNADEQSLLGPLGLRCRFEVIPNGVFLSEIDQPGATGSLAPPAAPAGRGTGPFILFLSRLHYKKGLDYLADAFAKVRASAPEWRLVVAGPDGGERQPFVERVERLGLNGSVELPGPVYGDAKYALLAQAACFCLPSRQEGFSVAILEALACRVPVVISENCHFPEVAEAGAGLVVPLGADAVATALLAIVADPARRAAMGEAGRRLVESRFTWDRVAERSIAAYERVSRP